MARRSDRPALTREAVVAAAVDLADTEGLAALSMRAVAKRVGVEAMSLYHHVANKEALLDAVEDAVFADFHTPVVGGPWAEEMRARSRSARAVLKQHPWAVGLMDSRTSPGWASLVHHDAVLGCLREAGFSWPLAASAFAALDAHLYGFLVQELALPFDGGGEDLEGLATQMLEALPEGALPYFTQFTLEHALAPGYDFGLEFDVGLELVIEGLTRRLGS